ncbi:hypothetical protein FWK35_00003265 [Aphis craccivora]|uniref:Uncharacterized protein n=1 Tax=Aphis craccivora TaxID=307492 RepID=A0A6G0Z5Z2_APHCR|nr:hypothetical protein FWK35_00003265 [Aphis craccivora]
MFSRRLSFLASFSAFLSLIKVLDNSLVFLMSSLSFCLRSKDNFKPLVLLMDENLVLGVFQNRPHLGIPRIGASFSDIIL